MAQDDVRHGSGPQEIRIRLPQIINSKSWQHVPGEWWWWWKGMEDLVCGIFSRTDDQRSMEQQQPVIGIPYKQQEQHQRQTLGWDTSTSTENRFIIEPELSYGRRPKALIMRHADGCTPYLSHG